MKYIVILGDGMSDYPVDTLRGKTPLDVSQKPATDALAKKSLCGMVKTIPDGMSPGSDTANLSVMGYDPLIYYSGRSPLEAVSMGVDMQLSDVSYRCNIVSLDGEGNYEDCIMSDYSCDEIPTEESGILIRFLDGRFRTEKRILYPGISYRHCLIVNDADTGCETTPPHDISDKCIRDFLPKGVNAEFLLDMMKESRELLHSHPINEARKKRGVKPAGSLWFWGEGRKPNLHAFKEKYNIRGAVVSAVDLIKGIGICADLEVISVKGATGNIRTNFRGKADAAIDTLMNGNDFVYIHIEAPDECGHRGEVDNKILSIEKIDTEVVGPIISAMESSKEDFRMLILPDHPTPLSLRTHVSDPVPFILYDSTKISDKGVRTYSEREVATTGVFLQNGWELMDLLIRGESSGLSF